MVFKIHLARQGIVKSLTHSYAQSLVAASQSSSASQNASFHSLGNNFANLFNKPGQYQPQQSAHAPPNPSSNLASKAAQADTASDGGLAAYYAAWQRHQKPEDKEAHQFQFAKRIGWKAPTTVPDGSTKAPEKATVDTVSDKPTRRQISRSISTSAVEQSTQPKHATTYDGVATSAAINDKASAHAPGHAPTSAEAPDVITTSADAARDVSPISTDTASNGESNLESLTSSQSTKATSVSEADSFNDHLGALAEHQQYGDIPAVFEAMLVAGIKPTSAAYNALLLAAINLPRRKDQVVPKVLDVYNDMLHRQVEPDTNGYAMLIEVLASRAIDVTASKEELKTKQTRFGSLAPDSSFLLQSDGVESEILAEDDSLNRAIKLFDTSMAVPTLHQLPAETYETLILATAQVNRISDMVRIYANLEAHGVTPPTSVFSPMITAFAKNGDLRSAVDAYNEYKALAIAHDNGEKMIDRRDPQVYAAVVDAYLMNDRNDSGLEFLTRIEESLSDSSILTSVQDVVALNALLPKWLSAGEYSRALEYANQLSGQEARLGSLNAISVHAADRDQLSVAQKTLDTLTHQTTNSALLLGPTMANLAMHLRHNDVASALPSWRLLQSLPANGVMIEATTMFASAMIRAHDAGQPLKDVRKMFSRIRESAGDKGVPVETVDQMDEAIELISSELFKAYPVVSIGSTLELLKMMLENGGTVAPVAERLLAGLGPDKVAGFAIKDVEMLMQVQSVLLLGKSLADVAHTARFFHLFEILMSSGRQIDDRTRSLVDQALDFMQRPDLSMQWQQRIPQVSNGFSSPAASFTSANQSFAPAEDTFDPYGSSTDFKGSSIIADELDKVSGRSSAHLNEALTKFRNMRRAGRHPRYAVYAKLITAAAKNNRMNLAHDILAMAQQDIPLIPGSKVVHHGWVSIMDSMIGAALTIGERDTAARFHQELLNMGAAPSANTFGLYITTLTDSTKTFDEATEAVKIFHRAKTEGVEPSSFLYNALIGKLGKARRIDDTLYYFAEMRGRGIRPTSVTYGTIVNALCRVSDDKFAEELFEEMESQANYKPRPAPYNSLMQFFLTTKRDRSKVLAYYKRMRASNIQPTMHTFKLLIDTHATIQPVDMPAAEAIIDEIRSTGQKPEPVHFAALIHSKGCVQHDMPAARALFDEILANNEVYAHTSLYQALFESYVANHDVAATQPLLADMKRRNVHLTPYIANTLIHGWANANNVTRAREIYDALGREGREPSTYEAMTRACLSEGDKAAAMRIVGEALRRGYPQAVQAKILEIVGGGREAEVASS